MTIYGKFSVASYLLGFFLLIVVSQPAAGTVFEAPVNWLSAILVLAGAILALIQNMDCSLTISGNEKPLSEEEYEELQRMIDERRKELRSREVKENHC